MPAQLAEIAGVPVYRALSSAHRSPSRTGGFVRWGQRTLQQPTKTAACERHRGDAFLPELVCRSDRRPEERSSERVFLRVDADCAVSFQIIRIVRRQV